MKLQATTMKLAAVRRERLEPVAAQHQADRPGVGPKDLDLVVGPSV
jgi:hypothetical protein